MSLFDIIMCFCTGSIWFWVVVLPRNRKERKKELKTQKKAHKLQKKDYKVQQKMLEELRKK